MAEKSEWTDKQKQEVIEAYQASNPTPENTTELLKVLGDKFGKTPNGVRMILSKANVYVKKVPTSSATGSTASGGKRVNKAAAIDGLKKTISSLNKDVDDDIVDRLTGKAAVYFNEILETFK